MHGKRQSWLMVALSSGVAAAIFVLLLPLLPVRVFGLPPYWHHLSLGVGIVVMLYVLTRNPAWRYLRAASMLIGILGVANTLPAFNLTVLSEWGVGHWSQDGASWHLNIGLIALLAVLFVLDYFTAQPPTSSQAREFEVLRDKPPTQHRLETSVRNVQFRRNRSQMLDKVRLIWIKGLLEPSLHQIARIELGLETKPDAIVHPFVLFEQRLAQAPQPLPLGTPISQIFDEVGKTLLLLGAPGAGKTILLLELTRDLLDRAAQDESHWIPVVFNLSSWVEQQLPLADWVVDELNKRYDVPRTRAQTWVDAGLICPLLDGLDEVADDHREACVETINAFRSKHNGLLPLVVCSRVVDYEALTVRLRLPSAVLIQALSRQQVENYVHSGGSRFGGVTHYITTRRNLMGAVEHATDAQHCGSRV